MKKILELKDSLISVNDTKFTLKSKNATLEISFIDGCGFAVDALRNTAGKREVNYAHEPQSIMPVAFGGEDNAATGEKSHELMNAVTRSDGEK